MRIKYLFLWFVSLFNFLFFAFNSFAQNISTIAGTGVVGFSGDGGPATAAQLYWPDQVAFDAAGNVFIADMWNHRIRKIDIGTGIITTIAGTGVNGFNSDGIAATAAQLSYPNAIAIDQATGDLYIADRQNQRIRKVTFSTGIINTIAGTGVTGYNGEGIAATSADLSQPYGVALDAAKNVYIVETWNSRVRKVTISTGLINTIAGTGTLGFSGDGGPAIAAELNSPIGVVVDATGNVYIADVYNHRIRKVDSGTGIISTAAGTTQGFSGDGGLATAAQLDRPHKVAFDASGNIYIADTYNQRIRKINTGTGIISTIAGTGTAGYNGDGIPPTTAQLNIPWGVAVDAAGCVYVGDLGNHRVRKFCQCPAMPLSVSGGTTMCSGSSATLTASGAASYVWSPGGQTTSGITVNPAIGVSTYTITGTDANGCTGVNTATVIVDPSPAINVSSSTTICSGSSATLTASGGTTYAWNTGATTTGIYVAPTITTTYSVIVSDGFCQDTGISVVTVVQSITASIAGPTTICNGQSVTLTAAGGANYSWSTSATTNSIIVTPTSLNTYSVLVTSGTCVDSADVTILVNTSPTAAISGNTTLCNGTSATLTASGGISYSWNTSATTGSISITPTALSVYTVTVTDANGCTATAISQVTVNANPTAVISGNTILCAGDNTTLTATGGGTYNWSLPAGQAGNGAITSSIMLTPTGTSSYIVTVTNGSGCTDTAVAMISVSPKPVAGILCSDTICQGDNAVLTAYGGGTYLWTSGQSTSSVSINPVTSTSYTVIVSIGTCKDTTSCTVIVQPLPVVNASPNVTITVGQSTLLTASIISASSAVNYSWAPAAGLSNPNISNPTAAPAITTPYCVTVTDVLGCTATACVIVTLEPLDCSNTGELYMPNAFSPNDDGENDILTLYYGNLQCIQTLELTIYDRWGEKVYESSNKNFCWDGTYRNKLQNVAVFIYYLHAILINGNVVEKKGNISLIR